jgi:hypothetical protein
MRFWWGWLCDYAVVVAVVIPEGFRKGDVNFV